MEEPLPAPSLADVVLGEQFFLSVPSRLDWIEPVVDHLTSRAVQCGAVRTRQSARVTIALHEALTNAIVHGNLEVSSDLKERGDGAFIEAVAARCADPRYADRPVEVSASYDGQWMRWAFTDHGPGFDVRSALARLEEEDGLECRASGRGLVMIRSFVDEVRWEESGRRVILGVRRPEPEKRAHPRHPLQQGVRVAPIREDGTVDWGAAHDALARDISQEGIGLLQAGLGQTERVLITIPVDGGTVSLPAEVRHWRSLGDNAVEVGCRFETAPAAGPTPGAEDAPAEALAALVGRLSRRQQPGAERRQSPRVLYSACIQVEGPGGQPAQGFARDLSRHGIAFVTTTPLTLEVRRLTLPQDEGRPPLYLSAQIVRCARLMDGYYDVGARFLGLSGW
jgi:anti-sigma regulatory factor (Ser/Thr protein kinase)